MTACKCGAPAGVAPVVTDGLDNPLCDRCVADRYGPRALAEVDQLRASASAALADPRRHEPAQQWLTSRFEQFVEATGRAPSAADPDAAQAFYEWLREIDPAGLLRWWPQLTGEDA